MNIRVRKRPLISRSMIAVGLTLVALVAEADPNLVFVTSTEGTGDLGSWSDAGDNEGLAAADAICQARAAAGQLDNAAGFVAWISDSENDAYCRIHGLKGKKTENCGQSVLPADAGPWSRVDGGPFSPTIDELVEGTVYLPVILDEFSNTVMHPGSGVRYFTGTDDSGARSPSDSTCGEWTNASDDHATMGETAGTTRRWTFTGGSLCTSSSRLLCMEAGPGPPLPAFAESGRIAFTTSIEGTGDLGSWPQAGNHTGIAAGDAICQSLASAAKLQFASRFKAWLSDSTVDARDRFQFDGPWVRLDGIRVADGLLDLVDRRLHAPVNVDELGVYHSRQAWTGTTGEGKSEGSHCDDWSSAQLADSGLVGDRSVVLNRWTDSSSSRCYRSVYALYCLADHAGIFEDGFEPGD